MGSLLAKPEKSNKKSNNNTNNQHQVTDKDRAVLDLKNARDRLKRFRKRLDTESEQLTNKAKLLIREQKKERALLVLKLKRHKEKEASNIDGQLISILEMIDNIEWESTNLEVMRALQAGNTALNKLHDEMSVEDVENLLAETNEAIETENQINMLLIGQLNVQDDEELQQELALLMGETTTEKPVAVTPPPAVVMTTSPTTTDSNDRNTEVLLPAVPTQPVQVLPSVPTHAVEAASATAEEEAELAAL